MVASHVTLIYSLLLNKKQLRLFLLHNSFKNYKFHQIPNSMFKSYIQFIGEKNFIFIFSSCFWIYFKYIPFHLLLLKLTCYKIAEDDVVISIMYLHFWASFVAGHTSELKKKLDGAVHSLGI